jgi:hypothetical protein
MDYTMMLSYGLVFLVIISIIMGMTFYKLHRDRKFVKNKLKCWFWDTSKNKTFVFLDKEDNGIEVKAPRGHSCPRYFYDESVIAWEKYPDKPPFGISALQFDVPSVEWAINNPEPSTPYKQVAIVTPRLIDALRDEDFAAYAMEADREMKEMEKELIKARATRINPTIVYVLGAGAMIAGIAAAVIAYQCADAIRSLW